MLDFWVQSAALAWAQLDQCNACFLIKLCSFTIKQSMPSREAVSASHLTWLWLSQAWLSSPSMVNWYNTNTKIINCNTYNKLNTIHQKKGKWSIHWALSAVTTLFYWCSSSSSPLHSPIWLLLNSTLNSIPVTLHWSPHIDGHQARRWHQLPEWLPRELVECYKDHVAQGNPILAQSLAQHPNVAHPLSITWNLQWLPKYQNWHRNMFVYPVI